MQIYFFPFSPLKWVPYMFSAMAQYSYETTEFKAYVDIYCSLILSAIRAQISDSFNVLDVTITLQN